MLLGSSPDNALGRSEGWLDLLGLKEGCKLGSVDDEGDEDNEGWKLTDGFGLGNWVGMRVGSTVGSTLGLMVGDGVGKSEGILVGMSVGSTVGSVVGLFSDTLNCRAV